MHQEKFECLLCHSDKYTMMIALSQDRYLTGRKGFDYVRCRSCALVQIKDIPPNLDEFYGNYPIHTMKSRLYSWFRLMMLGNGYYPCDDRLKGKKLLDVGCGDGWFATRATEYGANVIGFEPGEEHALQLSRIWGETVHHNWDFLDREEGTFDLVTMHYVMEHVQDPAASFQLASRALKVGGVFYFIIPNISSWEFGLFKGYWHGLDAPRHLQFLEGSHVHDLSQRLGFQVEKADFKPMVNTLAGSLATLPTGKFNQMLFFGFLPVSLLITWLAPSGSIAYTLRKL